QFRLVAAQHGSENHPSGRTKEFPPQLTRFFETLGAERLDTKSAARQNKRCTTHRRPGFFRDWSSAIVFEETDVDAPQCRVINLTHLDRRGARIAVVRTRHHFKQGPHVFYGARHRPDYSDQGKGAGRFRKVAGRRNASGSGLQSADAAEVRRDADRTAAVAAHAASGKS